MQSEKLKSRLIIVYAKREHIHAIAGRLRAADVEEIWALAGMTQVEALETSFDSSAMVFTALIDGRAEIMFGVGDVNVLGGVGAPWLLGTDAVEKHYRMFARESRVWLGVFKRRYRQLCNAVHADNTLSVRWLQWLGFTIHDPMPIGRDGAMIRYFELRTDHV